MSALANIDRLRYDFIDLGCSNGGSARHCMQRIGAARGFGIDIDPQGREHEAAGYGALIADARELDLERQVSFTTMLDFFEDLPDLYVHYEADELEAITRPPQTPSN